MNLQPPQLQAGRIMAILAAAIVALIAIGAVLWFVFVRPRQLQASAATARIQAAGSSATASAAQETIKLQVDHARQVVEIDLRTKEGENAVRSAEGASAASPDVAAAMRAALCLSSAHRADPACSAVRGSGGGERPVERDAGGDPAGER